MNLRQKIFRIGFIITAILILFIAIYIFLFKRGKNNMLYHVPNTSASVFVVNIHALFSKLLLDDLGRDIKSSSHIADFLPDTLKSIDWTSTGLGMPDKAVFFTIGDTASAHVRIYFIIPISDAQKFNLLMQDVGNRLNINVHEKDHIRWAYCSKPGLLLAWNKSLVIGMKTSENKTHDLEKLEQILSITPEKSLMADSCFVKMTTRQYDILFYSKPYNMYPFKKMRVMKSEMDYWVSFLNFSDGELEINAEIKAKQGSMLDSVFTKTGKSRYCLASPGIAIINIMMNVNPVAAKRFYNIYRPFDVKTGHLPATDDWDGTLHALFLGTKTVTSEYTTYEYDDNFNKIETRQTREETAFNVQAIMGTDNVTIDSSYTFAPSLKNNPDKQLFKGSNFIFEQNRGYTIAYHKQFGKPQLVQQVLQENINITVNYQKMVPILRDMGMDVKTNWLDSMACEKFNVMVNKTDNIHIAGKIYFAAQDKNSFYSILEKAHLWVHNK